MLYWGCDGIPFFYEKIFYNFHNESRDTDLLPVAGNDSTDRGTA